MPNTLRLAAFNVENLFARPKVFNFRDKSIGDRLLDRIRDFRAILKRDSYTVAEKRRLVKEYESGVGGSEDARPLKDFITVREDQGKLWKRTHRRITGVKANGSNQWAGTIVFKKARFSEIGRQNTAKVLKSVKADIACVVEADNRPNLKQFDTDMLRSRYRYEMLLDGNDRRGIDVGVYSRYPLGVIHTHMFDGTSASKTFSRDCPEYELKPPNSPSLYLLCNHLKSKGYGAAAASNARRKRQATAIAEILDRYDLRNDWVVIAGDLNDTPESAPLRPLLKKRNLYDVLEWKWPNEPAKRWTYHYRRCEQIDYLLVSKPLRNRLLDAGVERRGIHDLKKFTSRNADVTTEESWDSVTSWTNQASDHGAVWADIDLS